MNVSSVNLGLGLIGIGRPWGYKRKPLPEPAEAFALLRAALDAGIRFFDTAASYGSSETLVGNFLRTLDPAERDAVTVATKFGDHWEPGCPDSWMDHSYDALCRSLDRSFERLPKIDVLQVHRASLPVLGEPGVAKALEYARSRGIRVLGASVKEVPAAEAALADDRFSLVQIPFNQINSRMEPAFAMACERGKQVLVNRPFGEGRLLYGEGDAARGEAARVEALRFILARPFSGFILAGTSSPLHLQQNIAAFHVASGVTPTA